ncbi:MAG: acyl carrier protein [Kiritimatiellae bacterium]|nr:acyl carrier protein [Kiritimatiellia bacterium]MBQ9344564.1 acyl carrier protein [Kiritimatiellia bacterium]
MFTHDQIYKEITDTLVSEFELTREQLTPEARLVEDLDLDSIDAVDLVVRLQRVIGKRVSAEDFKQVRTLGDLVTAIEKAANG